VLNFIKSLASTNFATRARWVLYRYPQQTAHLIRPGLRDQQRRQLSSSGTGFAAGSGGWFPVG